jgi:tetratricopeptide (TPR) repeat protein
MNEMLFKRRNRAWIPALEKLAVTGHAFVAVGAGHLVGPDGVVALLRAKGYKVTRVPGALAPRTDAPPVSKVLIGPEPERGDVQAKVVLPAVPAFEVPVGPAGTYGVLELMVGPKHLLDTDLKVRGYVTWIYDCLTAVRRPGQSVAKARKMIEQDPTLCERAKFYLGDAKDTPPEKSLWVVDVPRVYNKLELERIPKVDRTPANHPDRCEPDKKRKHDLCTEIAVGDYVAIDGRFAMQSPHAERNSEGLIVFASVAPAPPPAKVTMRAFGAPVLRSLPPLATKPDVIPPASDAARDASVKRANEGTRMYATRDFVKAIEVYGEAVKSWPGNHVAWYGMAGSQIGLNNWPGATASMTRAFALDPSQPMYAMVLGYCTYELVISEARVAIAKRTGVPLASVSPDLSAVDFSRAEQMLRHAIKLDDMLWRAHYYLGRIARDGGRPNEAAGELTKALASAPVQPGPWIALAELYRKWQHSDHALAVAEQATQFVQGTPSSDVWYVLGMAHDDLRKDREAITAFTKAIDADAANVKAVFQRGQAYFRMKNLEEAKRDLEAFVASSSASTSLAFAKQQANKMLLDIAAKKRR